MPLARLALLPFALVLVGCGSEPFKRVPVAGKVTYKDGTPIPGEQVVVKLVPINPAVAGKDVAGAAQGDLAADGTLEGVTTHKFHDGAVPGRYKVVVVAVKTGRDGAPELTKAVPAKYQSADTTPLEFEVGGGSNRLDLQIEKP